MLQTPLNAIHRRLNAKLVDFAGYEMPIQYTSIMEEHLAVRNSVGVFDVSHMGEFEIRGPGALKFLQNITINEVATLTEGKVQYTAMCYEDGGIIDDLLLYNCGTYYMAVVNASNLKKDLEWMRTHAGSDVEISDRSAQTALLALQGPRSLDVLTKVATIPLGSMQYYRFVNSTIADIPILISRTGYTGELGFEMYFDASPEKAEKIWNLLFEAGEEFGIKPVGLGARDTLRLEMGFCLYGNDIDSTTNPLEAGLGWITKLEKQSFIGKEALVNVKTKGLKRRLMGFLLPERSIARHGYPIKGEGRMIGQVTSGSFSPVLGKAIAMGYIETDFAVPGAEAIIEIRGQEVRAQITKMPFIKK